MSDLVDKMVGRADLRILDGGDSAREAMQEAFKVVLDDMREWAHDNQERLKGDARTTLLPQGVPRHLPVLSEEIRHK